MKYVKKSVEVDAIQYNNLNKKDIEQFVGEELKQELFSDSAYEVGKGAPLFSLTIPTLEGEMKALPGDYIIKGVNGEFYQCKPDIFEKTYFESSDIGQISDGYHTFDELYRYRMLYNAAFFNVLAKEESIKMCKSRKHSDGKKCFGSDDWFVVMAILPTGQISNHYESKYWDLFNIPESVMAFEYDGHTPNEAADRIERYLKGESNLMTFEKVVKLGLFDTGCRVKRKKWNDKYLSLFNIGSFEEAFFILTDKKEMSSYKWNPSLADLMAEDWEVAR